MKDYILMFGLALALWAWINLHARGNRKQRMVQKETHEILLNRFKNIIRSDKKEGKKNSYHKDWQHRTTNWGI
jgi:hypothetical protein